MLSQLRTPEEFSKPVSQSDFCVLHVRVALTAFPVLNSEAASERSIELVAAGEACLFFWATVAVSVA